MGLLSHLLIYLQGMSFMDQRGSADGVKTKKPKRKEGGGGRR